MPMGDEGAESGLYDFNLFRLEFRNQWRMKSLAESQERLDLWLSSLAHSVGPLSRHLDN